jgi:hypothetical protein
MTDQRRRELVQWPPTEREWRGLLQSLPPDADRAAVRQAIKAAVREYVADEKRDPRLHDVWQRIAILSTKQKVTEFCRSILKLKDFPLDPDAEALLRHADAFVKIRSQTKARAAIYLTTARRGRLMSCLSLAWTGPGKAKMPISETGLFAEFLCAVTARVLPPGLEGAGVKRFVKRERARRAVLRLLKERWRGRVDMTIGEDKVYLIDASGRRKPD